jgi:hypothetical protein
LEDIAEDIDDADIDPDYQDEPDEDEGEDDDFQGLCAAIMLGSHLGSPSLCIDISFADTTCW